jgi:integrase
MMLEWQLLSDSDVHAITGNGDIWSSDDGLLRAKDARDASVRVIGHRGQWRPIMGTSEYDPGATDRQAWNAGRKVGAKRALKPKQIWGIRFYLDQHRRLRDRALFDVAIDSKLRGCDVVSLKIGDLVLGGQIRTRATVVQRKTGRPVQFELLSDARASLLAWLQRRGGALGDYVFPSRIDHADQLSTRQYARLVDEWVVGIGLRREEYGTHSLRRTKASIIYKATGNLRAVQILLGHTKIENTVRYLGVDVEDALTLAEGTEI